MPHVLSVNIGARADFEPAVIGHTGHDKRPVSGAVRISAPAGPGSGLAGDHISDGRSHGGPDQAVYAYSREDLDTWSAELGRDLAPGIFGENLTTVGVDPTNAVVGERWRIGGTLLQVTDPRIPCRTFVGVMDVQGWMKLFTERALCGTYFRVLEPGSVTAGDEIVLVDRPDHDVTVQLVFRALTLEPELLPRLLAVAPHLTEKTRAKVRRRLGAAV
ncbi:MOSC domain-containing protein [Actinosynnema sp. NPDC047251]|uniref:MOSC domain containing protein n=1 Tax=Saccharothrix espanaensis (strain ATCC 51144 / DSM 44229 / JCM 9112 / NBRC 15066 / NRRL 15764) TaxID=1179773 RepID=K0K5W1_SACES|nr:MOSC domain-containing protein [Saccharothrix espanaensis]CCH33666.1 MOSC domain containing protein [Saccharothrix espanaensis DSM 44229]